MFKLNRNILELYLKLMPVQMFLFIASSLSNTINGLIIGNLLSAIAMVAMGLVSPLMNIYASVASIVSGGAGILCGQYMGRGEAKKVDQVFSIGIITSVAFGALVMVGSFAFAGPLASILGADAETMADTISYIRGISLGAIPLFLIPTMMIFLQMCNKGGISLFSTLLLAVLNAVLSLVTANIFHAGIFGIGVATSLSRWLTLLFIVAYFMFKKDLLHFHLLDFDFKEMVQLLILGSPASLAGFLYSIRNVFINKYAFETAGNAAVNALAILGSFGAFMDMFNVGVGQTLTMLASVFTGERDSRSLKELMKIAIVIGEILCLIKFAVVYPFGSLIAQSFGATGEVVSLARDLLIWYAWSAPFNMFTLTMMGVYQSLGRARFCNLLYPLNCIITPYICCAFLSKIFGITAIWACYMIAEPITLLAMYINACIRKKGLATSVDDLLYLDKDFDTDNKISLTITNIDQVIDVSRNVQDFCLEHGIDNKRSMLSGLCMEEMAANVVEHGFHKDNKKNHSIDVFACAENDEVLLRLRDNCVPFDPHSKLKMYDDSDPSKNIGIKMVTKIAKEMNYQTTFGMNVLNIKL